MTKDAADFCTLP